MAERYFRDARVNRIFEGTNEINRMLIPGMLVRRGLKGELPLVAAARALQDEVLSASTPGRGDDEDPLGAERRLVAAFKKVALMVIGTALQTFGDRLESEQEVLSFAADVLIDTYAGESAVARAAEAVAGGHAKASLHEAATRVFVSEAAARVESAARSALAGTVEGDTLRTLLAALRRVLKPAPLNVVRLRRQLAEAVTAQGRYSFT
jgi:alkylation response protein AidB-like acyl-CoA dehydrogenase